MYFHLIKTKWIKPCRRLEKREGKSFKAICNFTYIFATVLPLLVYVLFLLFLFQQWTTENKEKKIKITHSKDISYTSKPKVLRSTHT